MQPRRRQSQVGFLKNSYIAYRGMEVPAGYFVLSDRAEGFPIIIKIDGGGKVKVGDMEPAGMDGFADINWEGTVRDTDNSIRPYFLDLEFAIKSVKPVKGKEKSFRASWDGVTMQIKDYPVSDCGDTRQEDQVLKRADADKAQHIEEANPWFGYVR